MPHEPQDTARLWLKSLAIPPASEQAVSRISQLARENPRRLWKGVGLFRQARALIYIPRMRYVIMACMVAFFIAVGMVDSPPPTHRTLTDEALLLDVDFEEEYWADNLLIESANGHL